MEFVVDHVTSSQLGGVIWNHEKHERHERDAIELFVSFVFFVVPPPLFIIHHSAFIVSPALTQTAAISIRPDRRP